LARRGARFLALNFDAAANKLVTRGRENGLAIAMTEPRFSHRAGALAITLDVAFYSTGGLHEHSRLCEK